MNKMTTKDRASLFFFLLGAAIIFATSFHYFHTKTTGIITDKTMSTELWYHIVLRIHIVFGLIAIFTGPFQLFESIRNKNLALHRKLGYVYSVSVFISGIFGLLVAQFAIGGIISTLGFSSLAIAWIYSILRSIWAIRHKKVSEHQKWMFINYSLTFAAIPQRFFLAFTLVTPFGFTNIYRMSAWIPWILSGWVGLYLYQRILKKNTAS